MVKPKKNTPTKATETTKPQSQAGKQQNNNNKSKKCQPGKFNYQQLLIYLAEF
jgi:hypothetical protein